MMLSRTITHSLPRQAQPATPLLLSRLSDALPVRREVAPADRQRRNELFGATRAAAFASQSAAKLSPPVALHRLEPSLAPAQHDQSEDDFVKNALHALLHMNDGVSKRIITQEELSRRLKSFQVLLQEARQCIEDCADSAESDDFDEEAVTAMEAVEEACSSFGEIIDDLEGAEKLSDPYPFGVVKRSDFVRLSQGMKVQKLKEELAMIVREWRSPPEMRPAD
eukprot:CAMPEP_0197464620 /NCGR_PEP_ID=MMETSP1175-20131217/64114_1 /TAXON_ID=1003142 /ORGANISM="Triceratium dubium, Strain CCMP147" /LENGTH=222 /DNA_ID=CAMNT_0043000603 /DNA_START=431 /DNA_END=1099 /DNA_ORIENTATION=+